MDAYERSDRLPLTVDREVLLEVVRARTLESAVAIVGNLDPLSAAFIVSHLRFLAEKGDNNAKVLVALCDNLHIRGTLGLIYARDKVYHETGYFAGI